MQLSGVELYALAYALTHFFTLTDVNSTNSFHDVQTKLSQPLLTARAYQRMRKHFYVVAAVR